jgi:hypothetical protein
VLAHAFSPTHQRAAAARRRLPERATAVALLVLLHVALLFLINPQFRVQKAPLTVNEITLSFHAAMPREAPPPAINPVLMKPNAIAPPVIPQSNLASVPPLAAPGISGVGRSLFNCDLANTRNLPPEKRANCLGHGTAPPAAETVEAGMPKRSKAKNGVLWAAELAARQTPPEVPCTSVQQQVFGGPGVQKPVTTIMADPLCLLNGFFNGFQAHAK